MYNWILVSKKIILNIKLSSSSQKWASSKSEAADAKGQRHPPPPHTLPMALGFWKVEAAEFLVLKVWSLGELINVARKEQFYDFDNHKQSFEE